MEGASQSALGRLGWSKKSRSLGVNAASAPTSALATREVFRGVYAVSVPVLFGAIHGHAFPGFRFLASRTQV